MTRFRRAAFKFIDRRSRTVSLFFLWPIRRHAHHHASIFKWKRRVIRRNGWTILSRHGTARKIIGDVMKKLRTWAWTRTPSSSSPPTTAEIFTGPTPRPRSQKPRDRHGRRVPRTVPAPLARQGPCRQGGKWPHLGARLVPRCLAAAEPTLSRIKRAKELDRTKYKVLDGYNQMDLITGKGRRTAMKYSLRRKLARRRAIDDYKYRFIDQPGGWLGDKTTRCALPDLASRPFERTGWPGNGTKDGRSAVLRLVQVRILEIRFRQQQGGNWLRRRSSSAMQKGEVSTSRP